MQHHVCIQIHSLTVSFPHLLVTGVYTRISGVYDWIQEQICNLSDNPPASCGRDDETTGPTSPGNGPTTPSDGPATTPDGPPGGDGPTTTPSDGDCEDSDTASFRVGGGIGDQVCSWLADNIEQFDFLCRLTDVALACRKTCDTCKLLN